MTEEQQVVNVDDEQIICLEDVVTQKEILNRKEAAAFLNMAPNTLTKYAKQGLIPCRKLERRVLFSRKALELWASGQENND